MEPKSDKTQPFYRWVDAEGRLHVVSSLDAVPVAQRPKVERITLHGAEAPAKAAAGVGAGFQLDWASFGLGFAAALLLTLAFRLLPNAWRGVTRVAVVLAVAALLTGLYLGAIRRQTGTGAGAFATPSAIIEDAKSAVEKLNARQKLQEEELRKIQAEGR